MYCIVLLYQQLLYLFIVSIYCIYLLYIFIVSTEVAKSNEDKFKKMKDIYGKLREEHVGLIRREADVKKQLHAEKMQQGEIKQTVVVSTSI